MKKHLLTSIVALAISGGAASASQIVIHTGGGEGTDGKGSTYHEGIGEGVKQFLEPIVDKFGYDVVLMPSNGAVDNANKVGAATDGITFGIGQGGLDYDAVESGQTTILRSDLPGECAMAMTAEGRISDWGDVIENASRVTWVVPENSGSEAFIKKIYAVDENLAGHEPSFQYAAGQDEILSALTSPSSRGTVGFYYAYPNPTSGLVSAAADADIPIFGVLSPDVAKTSDAYYLNRQAPYQLSWFGLGETKTTRAMCSRSLLFANDPESIDDPWARQDARDIMAAITAAPASAFTPQDGGLAKLMKTVEGLAEEGGINDMIKDLEAQISRN